MPRAVRCQRVWTDLADETAKSTADRRELLRDVRRHGADAEMTNEDREALPQLLVKPIHDGVLSGHVIGLFRSVNGHTIGVCPVGHHFTSIVTELGESPFRTGSTHVHRDLW